MGRITLALLFWLPLTSCATEDPADGTAAGEELPPTAMDRRRPPSPARYFGCYELEVSQWSPELTNLTGLYELPPEILLSGYAYDDAPARYSTGWSVYPHITGPDGAAQTGRWRMIGDTIALAWTDGVTGVMIAGRIEEGDSIIAGEATALHAGRGSGVSRAPASLRRTRC